MSKVSSVRPAPASAPPTRPLGAGAGSPAAVGSADEPSAAPAHLLPAVPRTGPRRARRDGRRVGRPRSAALPAEEGHRRRTRLGSGRRDPGPGRCPGPRRRRSCAGSTLSMPEPFGGGGRGDSVRLAVPLLLLAALLSKNVFSYFSEFAFNGIGLAMVRDLRRDAYRTLLYQSTRFYSQSSTGRPDERACSPTWSRSSRPSEPGWRTSSRAPHDRCSCSSTSSRSNCAARPVRAGPRARPRPVRSSQLHAPPAAGPAFSSQGADRRDGCASLARRSAATGSSRPTRWRTSRRSASATPTTATSAPAGGPCGIQALNSPLMEILAGIGLSRHLRLRGRPDPRRADDGRAVSSRSWPRS